MTETDQILLNAAKAFENFAGSMVKFAETIKSQGEACDHKRLFVCGCELLGAAGMMSEWAEGIKEEVESDKKEGDHD